ncbi:uncharacterized protein LOC135477227 [Liolophura sinensis]|uniref:uncharacterized protein LOC135477227 n=1 Tax=Liolophura sinensis TaxID=3198878 RepID=UPI0031582B17
MAAKDEIDRLKNLLGLQPHPAGFGSFVENWRAERQVTFVHPTSHDGPRSSSSSIYFMLEGTNFISFHLLLSDEFFYWHAGGKVKIHLIDKDGNHSSHLLGDTLKNPECRYYVAVPHDTWYAAEIIENAPYVLYSAVVAPGWELRDWTEGKKDELSKQYPQHKEKFEKLCYI